MRINDLYKSILQAAFSGRLVPQDPNDEPAEILLKRIREERESEHAKSKSSNRRKRLSKSAFPAKSRGG